MIKDLDDHTIINVNSKSWFIGKPGTTKNSYHLTWSSGMLVIYGELGSITLTDPFEFKVYQSTRAWIEACSIESFMNKAQLYDDSSVNDFFAILKFWASEVHFT